MCFPIVRKFQVLPRGLSITVLPFSPSTIWDFCPRLFNLGHSCPRMPSLPKGGENKAASL